MIGSFELLIILLAALFVFGPDKIPDLARTVGKAFGDFKKAQLSAEMGLPDFDMQPKNNSDPKIDKKVRDMAESAGIDTEAKTTDEILLLIREKVKLSSE